MAQSAQRTAEYFMVVHATDGTGFADVRNCEADVPLEAQFTELVHLRLSKSTAEGWSVSGEVESLPIQCRVLKIELYRRDFDVVCSGYTARVWLDPFPRQIESELARANAAGNLIGIRGLPKSFSKVSSP